MPPGETSPPFSSERRSTAFPVVPWIAAAMCIGLSVSIGASSWATWFHHPTRMPMPQATLDGARLFRMMLLVSAGVLVVAPILWHRLCRVSMPWRRISDRRIQFAILGLVVFGAALRWLRIEESLWYDEIAMWLAYGAGIDWPGPIVGNYFDPVNHVFQTLLSWVSVRFLGETLGDELALRLPALLFSLAFIVVMGQLGSFVSNRRTAILAAALAALLPVCVLEGTEARGYSMMMFFSALATWLLLAARRSDRPSLWQFYALACALGAWSHPCTVFIPLGHGVCVMWRAWRDHQWRAATPAFVALIAAAAFTITLYAPMLPDMIQTQRSFAEQSGSRPSVFGAEGLHALLQMGGSWAWWAAVPGLVAFCVGLPSLWRKQLAGPLFAGLIMFVLVIVISGSWMYARFALFAMPGAILAMTAGIDRIWSRRMFWGLSLLSLIVIGSLVDLWTRPSKQPLREAAQFVREHQQTGDRVLEIGLAHEVMRAYANGLDLTFSLRHGESVPALLDSDSFEWVIVEYPLHVREDAAAALRARGYSVAAQFEGWADWGHGDVVVMRRDAGR